MQKGSEQSTKRDEILDVASRLFYEQGYNKTGVQQIIAEAGAAKGTFYSHFKSKEDLGIAWLKARHITWNSWLNDAIRNKRSARAKIVGIFDFLGIIFRTKLPASTETPVKNDASEFSCRSRRSSGVPRDPLNVVEGRAPAFHTGVRLT